MENNLIYVVRSNFHDLEYKSEFLDFVLKLKKKKKVFNGETIKFQLIRKLLNIISRIYCATYTFHTLFHLKLTTL